MAIHGPNMPMDIGSPDRLWKGGVRTNGFLMGNVNSRVPAVTEGFSSITIDVANPQYTDDVITWGCGMWRNTGEVDTKPGARYADAIAAGTKPRLLGIYKFNQGWQASHPVQPYGAPSYSTGTIIRSGLVGYETALAYTTAEGVNTFADTDYMEYLKGDSAYDVNTTRTLYEDWVTALAGAAAGAKLGLFFHNASGFPVVSIVLAANLNNPTLAGCTFAGFEKILAKEHGRIYFDVNL